MNLDLYILAAIFLVAGISHFLFPKPFLYVMPGWVPFPVMVNLFVGFAEIALAVLLFYGPTRTLAAWSLILLLIAVFPANINHFQKARRKHKHVLLTALRLPLQFGLIYWVCQYT